MPSDDDDSSLQFQKLLSTPSPSSPSTGVGVKSTCGLYDPINCTSGNVDDISLSFDKDNSCSSPKQQRPNDPENCYSWLLHGRGGKYSEGALSSDGSTSSSSSSSESSFTSLPLPPPPDGGWGWMVVLGAFIILFICDGLAYCFGILYHELLVQFGESRSKTSLVGSIFFGVSMILGPFASAMTTRFGCKKMTIVGGVLSFLGFMLSCFANSIEMLIFTFSVVVGTGFSFCYVTSAVVVHFYFDKRRSLATGLSVCGTGVGTFAFAPLMEYLIGEYGLRGMFFIMAAISLNLVVSGMLFISLKFTEAERWQHYFAEFDKLPHCRENLELGRLRTTSESTDFSLDVDVFDEESRTMSMLSLPTFITDENKPSDPSSEILREALKNSKNPHLTYMRYMKNAYLRTNKKLEQSTTDQTVTISIKTDSFVSNSKTLSEKENINQSTSLISSKKALDNTQQHNSLQKSNKTKLTCDTNMLPFKEDVRSSASFLNNSRDLKSKSISKVVSGMHMGKHNAMGMQLLLYRTDIFYRRQINQPIPDNRPCLLATSCPELVEPSGLLEAKYRGPFHQMLKNFQSEISEILRSMIDVSLFQNVFFTVFVVSNFMFYFWNDIPYMFASDHSVDQGISTEKASFLISIVGICSAIGQLVYGAIGDTNCNLINVFAISLALSGILTALVPWMETYWSMALIYALFGFFVSVNFPFCSVLLVNYLGVEQLTNAYGLLMLMQGIANIMGPPFAGWISDETKSYDYAFYLSGLFFLLSGLVMYVVLMPCCRAQKVDCVVAQEKIIPAPTEDVDDGDAKMKR